MQINIFKIVSLFVLIFISSSSVFSAERFQEKGDKGNYVSSFNWKTGNVQLNYSSKINDVRKNRAQAFYFAESTSNLRIIHRLLKSILAIRVDSHELLGNVVLNSNYMSQLKDKIESSVKVSTSLSRNLDMIKLSYNLSIFPEISSFLVNHTQASSFQNNLIWTASENYTGLVIYAGIPLDVHGTYVKKFLNPALFIKIYDEDMNVIIEKGKMSPEYLKKWGSVAYTDDFNESSYRVRIGKKPLRTIAKGIFGTNYTDIILSDKVIEKLWSTKKNSKILEEGRILVIISPEKIVENLLLN